MHAIIGLVLTSFSVLYTIGSSDIESTFVTAWGVHTLLADASLWVRTLVTTLAAGVVAVSVIAIWPSLRGHVVQMYRTLVTDRSASERFTESGQ